MNKKIKIFFICLIFLSSLILNHSVISIENINILKSNIFQDNLITTTGPNPPEDCGKDIDSSLLTDIILIEGVPAYEWHHGCSPTSAGMIIGYWDSNGFDNLVEGSASSQNNNVNNMIASYENYRDYCLPIDDGDNIKPDKSELPIGDEHIDNSIADFIGTSQSYIDLWYGASWVDHIDNGMKDYINWKYSDLFPVVRRIGNNLIRPKWQEYCVEIDNNHPVLLSVDSNGDGQSDHSIVGIGYNDDDENHLYYGCYNTWDRDIHWYEWRYIDDGVEWGVNSMVFCNIKNYPYKPNIPEGLNEGITGTKYNYSAYAYDIDGDRIKFGWNWTGIEKNQELTVDQWTEFYDPGETCIVNHSWNRNGNYDIRVKVVDTDEAESPWSDPLTVAMPRVKIFNQIPDILIWLFERFPFLQPYFTNFLKKIH